MQHGVLHDFFRELFFLFGIGQFAIHQQIRNFEKVAVFCQLFNWIASVIEQPFFAIDIGNLGVTRCCRQKARIVGKDPVLAQVANIDDIRSQIAGQHGQIDRRQPVIKCKCDFCRFHLCYQSKSKLVRCDSAGINRTQNSGAISAGHSRKVSRLVQHRLLGKPCKSCSFDGAHCDAQYIGKLDFYRVKQFAQAR